MTTAHFESGDFGAMITLEMLPTLPLVKIRKLLKLMLSEPNRNAEAIAATEAWLAAKVIKVKYAWTEASKDYQNNYRATYPDGSVIPEARQKKINQPLISAVKKAKANFERTQKIQFIFQEIQNKEKKNYA